MAPAIAAIGTWAAANATALTAASMAITAASAATSYIGQSEQADATKKYNSELQENAQTAYNYRVQQDQTRMVQEAQTAGQKMFEQNIQAARGVGSVEASAAARGISGGSVDAMANEYYSQAGRNNTAIASTQNNVVEQLTADEHSAAAGYDSAYMSQRPVTDASLAGLGLGINLVGGETGVLAQQARDKRMSDFYALKSP